VRILVIGGTGFMGPHVLARLTEMGHDVKVFHRGQTGAVSPDGVEHIRGDRGRLGDYSSDFSRFAPEVVLDMIPYNAQDAWSLINAFKGVARRAVAISSEDVYRAYGRIIRREPGPTEPVPLTEEAPLRGRLYPYRGEAPRDPGDPEHWLDDYEKILVERLVMGEPSMRGTILRLPAVHGPGDKQHRLFPYLKRMDDGRPAILLDEGLARWRWTRGYVENVAAAIALAVVDERAAGRIYNIGEEGPLPEAEWVRRIGEAAGWDGEVIPLPGERLPPHLREKYDRSQDLVVDTTRIREELGYREPIPQREALRRTIAWERANPPKEIDPSMFDYGAEDAAIAEPERGR